MEKICSKYATKTSFKLLFYFGKQLKKYSQCIQENLLEIKYFDEEVSETLKKFNFIFFRTPSLPKEIAMKSKRDLEIVLVPFQGDKYVQKFSFFSDPLPDDLI